MEWVAPRRQHIVAEPESWEDCCFVKRGGYYKHAIWLSIGLLKWRAGCAPTELLMSYLLVSFTHYMLPNHLRADAVLTVIGHGSSHLRSEVRTGVAFNHVSFFFTCNIVRFIDGYALLHKILSSCPCISFTFGPRVIDLSLPMDAVVYTMS